MIGVVFLPYGLLLLFFTSTASPAINFCIAVPVLLMYRYGAIALIRLLKHNPLLSLAINCLIILPSQATTVRVIATESDLFFQQGNQTPPQVTLQMDSVAVDTPPEILIYQIGLSIIPAEGSIGSVGFAAANEPENYLFSGSSTPLAIPFLPQSPSPSFIDVSDSLILNPTGVELLSGQPKGIVDLTFDVSDDAVGEFSLVLAPFTDALGGGSSWASELVLNPSDALAFQNAQAGSSVESRVLSSIVVHSVPEPSSVVALLLFMLGFSKLNGRLVQIRSRLSQS